MWRKKYIILKGTNNYYASISEYFNWQFKSSLTQLKSLLHILAFIKFTLFANVFFLTKSFMTFSMQNTNVFF